MSKYKYYLVNDDGTVEGTNHALTVKAAREDGATLVIDIDGDVSTFDGDSQPIERADPRDWVDPESESEGDES